MKPCKIYWIFLTIFTIVGTSAGGNSQKHAGEKSDHETYLKELKDLQARLEDLYGAGKDRISNLEVIQDGEQIVTVTRNPKIDLFRPKSSNMKHKSTQDKWAVDDRWKSSGKRTQGYTSKQQGSSRSEPSWRKGLSRPGTQNFRSSSKSRAEGLKSSSTKVGTFETVRSEKVNHDEQSKSDNVYQEENIKKQDVSNYYQDQTEDPSVESEISDSQPASQSNEHDPVEVDLNMNVENTPLGNGGLKWTSSIAELVPIVENVAPVPPNKTRIQLELDNYDSFEPVKFQLENDKLRASVNVEPLRGHGTSNNNYQIPVEQYPQQPIPNIYNDFQSQPLEPYQQNYDQNQWPQAPPNNNYYYTAPPPIHHLNEVEKDILRKKFGPSPESSNNPISRFFGKIEEQILPNKLKKYRFPQAHPPPFHNHNLQQQQPNSNNPRYMNQNKMGPPRHFKHHPHRKFLHQKDLARKYLKKRFREKKHRKLRKFN